MIQESVSSNNSLKRKRYFELSKISTSLTPKTNRNSSKSHRIYWRAWFYCLEEKIHTHRHIRKGHNLLVPSNTNTLTSNTSIKFKLIKWQFLLIRIIYMLSLLLLQEKSRRAYPFRPRSWNICHFLSYHVYIQCALHKPTATANGIRNSNLEFFLVADHHRPHCYTPLPSQASASTSKTKRNKKKITSF